MTPYLAILNARFRTLLQYRAAAAAGFGTQLFWGLIRLMIFEAFYRSTTAPQPLTWPQMVDYIWLAQAFFALLPWSTDADVRTMIRTGTVAYEMLRPVDLYGLWFMRAVAARTAPTLLRSVPLIILARLFFGLRLPPLWESALAFGLTLFGAVLIAGAISTLVTVSLLWTVSGDGIMRMAPAIVYTFSGMLVPLPFYPDWAQAVVNFLPFRDIIDVPFRVYMGNIPPAAVLAVFAHQIVWTVALVLMGRWLLARATHRLVVQGG
jgi:ABC-2 type transport system permease protein